MQKKRVRNSELIRLMATALAGVCSGPFAIVAVAQITNDDDSVANSSSVDEAVYSNEVFSDNLDSKIVPDEAGANLVTSSPKAGEALFLFEFTGAESLDIASSIESFPERIDGGALLPMHLLVNPDRYDVAVIRLLDKVTTRLETQALPLGSELTFGSLTLTAEICLKNPTDQTPEATSFLRIVDRGSTQEIQELFAGWMFASSPALNALDHAIYDVWVIDCQNLASSSNGGS